MRIISYGGGVQSTALVVLVATGRIPPVDAALFANVGDDSEHPETLRYVRDVATPWAAARGVAIVEVCRRRRDGSQETLMGRLHRSERSLPIPVRMPDTGAPGRRTCTVDFKLGPIKRWLFQHGVTREQPAEVLIGFSLDEAHRVSNKRTMPYESPVHPLLDLRLTRDDCKALIRDAGLPVPPKSACYFCPFHRPAMWARMRRDEPALFAQSVALEKMLNERRDALGRDRVYFTRFGRPLQEAIHVEQQGLPFDAPDTDSCDEGYCWT